MVLSEKASMSGMMLRLRSIERRKQRRAKCKMIANAFFSGLIALASVYFLIGAVSLAEVCRGANIQYSEFWHGPWRILFSFIFN